MTATTTVALSKGSPYAGAFGGLLAEFYDEESRRPGSLVQFDRSDLGGLVDDRLSDPGLHYHVIMLGGQVVGFLGYSQIHQGLWEFLSIYIQPQFRGQGVAGRALDQAVALMRFQGMTGLVMEINSTNEASVRLFRRLGRLQPVQVTYRVQFGA